MLRRIVCGSVILLGLYLGVGTVATGAGNHIDVHAVEGIINPVVVEYMSESIERAEAENAMAVIFQLDSPEDLSSPPV